MAIARIDGLDKVLGRKLYARDLRARDLTGWPRETRHALLLRAEHADRRYLGIEVDRMPAALRPERMVTAKELADDEVRALSNFGSFLLVPEGRVPDHLGQPVAIALHADFMAAADCQEWLRAHGAPLRYGERLGPGDEQDVRRIVDPLLFAVEREPAFDYGSVHYVRIAGDGEDVFSHVHDGGHDPTAVGPEVHEDFRRERNLAARAAVSDIERAIAVEGWRVFDRTVATPCTDPMFMEPEAGLAWRDGDTLRLVVATQSPHKDIDDIQAMLRGRGSPFRGIAVSLDARPPGGAFGGRDSSSFPLYLALAALYSDTPVRLAFDRFEQFVSGIKRHAAAVRTRLAVDEQGTMQALLSHTVLDGGGQSNLSRPVMGVAALHAAGPYRIARTAASVSAIHTDAAPAGSMRGFGIPQVAFCVETLVDQIAQTLGEDPIAYRKRHVLRRGERDMTGMALEHHIANERLCELAAAEPLWTEREETKRARDESGLAYGVGFAMCMEAFGTTRDGVLAEVAIDREGRIVVRSSAVDFGQGTGTALAIATAPCLGRHADAVELGQSRLFDALELVSGREGPENTRWTPKVINSMSASMTAFHHVHGVEEACRVVFDHGLRRAAASLWGRDAAAARWTDGRLELEGAPSLSLEELAARAHDDGAVVGAMVHTYYQGAHASAEYRIDGVTARRSIDALAITRGGSERRELVDREQVSFPSRAMSRYRRSLYASIAHLVAVEVQTDSGRVSVTDAVTLLDAGDVHHEALLRGQVEGGFAMGLGFALLEEMPPAPAGTSRDWNLHRYEVPRARHLPLERMKLVLVPLEGELLAHGPPIRKKGIAEAAMSTVAPAVANAIAHATGARINTLPMVPARVMEALSRS